MRRFITTNICSSPMHRSFAARSDHVQSPLRHTFKGMQAMPFSSRTIFDPEPNEKESTQDNQQLPNDKPWDGEESVADSVLRMVMDKYNKPLRVEGAARRNLPQPQTYAHPIQGLYDKHSQEQQEDTTNSELSSGEKAMLRDKMTRSKRQKRIMSARDAALDYSLEKKYPSSSSQKKKGIVEEDNEWMERPKSIAEMGLLAEERIREARAKGHFDYLPGRGKPIPTDINENNPFVDRTEYFLNRIVQRQGAAPPWIMMQQEVDTETTKFRTDLERSLRLYVTTERDSITTSSMALREWRHNNQGYFGTLLEKLNGRLRSYNVMCPASVRKNRLDLEEELQDVYRRITTPSS